MLVFCMLEAGFPNYAETKILNFLTGLQESDNGFSVNTVNTYLAN